ncbi:hypothetical protein [Xanthobacter agilis]|uniref:Lipoprotein n=1 Tax=Xanthobacter agilis TaxID=47492 RepID=A0ABU0LJV5_XANAG|nr:hypothetical protein [Xanthobacter agilis]MDQ0507417.1 hypothetical protein [Xanthobacter agilis]
MVRQFAVAICVILALGGAACGAETFRDPQKYGDCLVERGVVIARKLGVSAERASELAGVQCKFVGDERAFGEGDFGDGIIYTIEQRLAQSTARSPNNLTDAQRRKIVLPAIKLSTDCIAAEAAKDPDILDLIRDGILYRRTPLYADRCHTQLDAMSEIYDRVYGTGKGKEFVEGPYGADLPRAVTERIQSGRFKPAAPIATGAPPAAPTPTTAPASASTPVPPHSNAAGPGRGLEPPALPSELIASDFAMKDLPLIHQTYGDNQARFVRDYRNKTFGASMSVLGIREAMFERGEFHVALGEKSNIDVMCNSLTPDTMKIIYSINKGDSVYVKGRIDDHTFGMLILQDCSISTK